MFRRETNRDEEISPGQVAGMDRLGRQIVRASGLSDEECDSIASSPMLFARIRAQIAGEQAGASDSYSSWPGMILAAWRAIPVMAIIAIIAAALFLFTAAPGRTNRNPTRYPDSTASFGPGGQGPVSACSISSKGECGISTEDVLATMIDQQREDSGR